MYLTGPKKCPAILEVVREPYWDPDRVDREGGEPAEGDRWGVVTEVRGVAALPIDQAPAPELFDIVPRSLGQKGHVALEDWQYEQAERLITGSRPKRRRRRTSREIPIESSHVEGYDVTSSGEVLRAVRRESRLVREYVRTLDAQGDSVLSHRLTPPDTEITLRTDVFNSTRNQLVEAKAGRGRGDIRMAIGQLADYARFLDGNPDRAVLLEAKPQPDLIELLLSQGISVIWREGRASPITPAARLRRQTSAIATRR
jgi:hypothetical protein